MHRKWVQVFDRIRGGEMPPPETEQPSPTDREQFLASLSRPLALSDRRRQQREGRTVLRRLNPFEYEYTVRDLLAAPWLEIRDMLPAEREMYGFDNVAEAQDFSYVQMARYLEAAEVAIGSIEPDTRGATTVREQLAKHREVASCASCHATIDPPGFALESFDVMVGWRDRYRTTNE